MYNKSNVMYNKKKIIITPVISPPVYKQLDPLNYELNINLRQSWDSNITTNISRLSDQNIQNNAEKKIKKFNFKKYKDKENTLNNSNMLFYNAHNNSEYNNNSLSMKHKSISQNVGSSNISYKFESDYLESTFKIESNVNKNTVTTISDNDINLSNSDDWFSEIPKELEQILDNKTCINITGNNLNKTINQQRQLDKNILDVDTLNKIDNLANMLPSEEFIGNNKENVKLTSCDEKHKVIELDFTELTTINQPLYSYSMENNETETLHQCKKIKTTSIQQCANTYDNNELSAQNTIFNPSFSGFSNPVNNDVCSTKIYETKQNVNYNQNERELNKQNKCDIRDFVKETNVIKQKYFSNHNITTKTDLKLIQTKLISSSKSVNSFGDSDNKINCTKKKKYDCILKTSAEVITDKNKITDYFPIIKEKNTINKNITNDCKKLVPKFKKSIFIPPPIKEESVKKRFDIFHLNEKNIIDLENNLTINNSEEISFNIIFKENCCLLSQTQHENSNYNPTGIIIHIVWKFCIPQMKYPDFYFLNLSKSFWNDVYVPRNFLMKLFTLPCVKLCFKAQYLIITLINTFSISVKEIEMNWMIFDPLVEYWLVDPDNPAITFYDILNNFKVFLNTYQSNVFDNACQLLIRLSAVSKKLQCFLEEKQLWNLFINMEMKIITILSGMEYHGILVNIEILQNFGNVLKNEIETIEKKAYESVGRTFQINSTVQLRIILYDELKLDVKNKIIIQQTANIGAKSTSEAMLQLLEKLHPLPGLVLQYRHLSKIKSTYIDSILQHVQKGIIYTKWEQTSAATGRIASCNPNLQAIPKLPVSLNLFSVNDEKNDDTYLNLRSAYVTRSGYSFLAADFHHIELRVFAHFSRDKTIINALYEPGDIFLSLTKIWLEVNSEEITAKQREDTKRLVYATMYGAGPSKIAGILKITTEEAVNVIKKFTNKFPSLKEFSRNTIDLCRQQGCLRSLSGRNRLFPNINNPIYKLKAQAERQAINFRIQGSAADICKSAMIISQKCLQKYDCKLLLQIHDELVWEVLDEQVSHVKEIVKNVMEDTDTLFDRLIKFAVPLPVSVTVGKNLGDLRS